MSNADLLRDRAERCLRMSKHMPHRGMAQALADLAARYLKEADAIHPRPAQQQQQRRPEPAKD
jgi:hypothetical protein